MQILEFFLGTYTQTKSNSLGIYRFKIDASTGVVLENAFVAKCDNPSFITFNQDKTKLFAACEVEEFDEKPQGYICEYDINGSALAFVKKCGTIGKAPCHIMTTSNNKYLVATNYGGASTIMADVQNINDMQVFMHLGKGENKQRQEMAHPHTALETLNGNYLIVPDLGMDTIVVYDIAQTPPIICQQLCYKARPADGPRAAVFHPSGGWLYVINELSASITVLECRDVFCFVQNIELTDKKTAHTSGADIHISENGNFLYASVRGNNTLVVYQIDGRTGKLTLKQTIDCHGKTPRQFALFANDYLLCGNQFSDNITVFEIAANGLLSYKFVIKALCPVCILPA